MQANAWRLEKHVLCVDMHLYTSCAATKKSCNHDMFPSTAAVPSQRHFPSDFLEVGAPNLLVTAPGVCVCVCVCERERERVGE